MSDDPTLDVARDLREIARLADMLHDQAYHHANARDFPGGDAFVQAAPVANQEAWANRYDTAERRWLAGQGPAPFTEDDDETALQLLEFWWERWLFELDGDCDHDATLQTVAAWLARPDVQAWAQRWEQRFDAFASDVANARRILENTLVDGDRSVFGVLCPRCHEKSLIRVTEPRLSRKRCGGHGHRQLCPWPMPHHHRCSDRGGLQEVWECPNSWRDEDGEVRKCGHRMTLADYESAVMRDYIANAPYLRAEHIERRTFVKPGTVKMWAHRGHVKTRRDAEDRVVYCVDDVLTRHAAQSEIGDVLAI